jgi:multiple sugar transport system permease protein
MFLYDKDLWQAMKVTGVYTAISVPLSLVLSFSLALLLNRKIKGVGVFRVLIYLPVIIPVTAGGILWRNFTDADYGMANKFLTSLGAKPFPFFTEAKTSMPSLIFIGLWGLGGGMILWLSALKNVPETYYEAAKIDGANAFVRLFKITVPMCTPMIFYNLVMSVIGSLQTFGSVYTLTGGSPGKNNALLFYLMKVYNDAFNIMGATMGYAAAMSWLLFLVIAALTFIVFKTSKWVFYGEDGI